MKHLIIKKNWFLLSIIVFAQLLVAQDPVTPANDANKPKDTEYTEGVVAPGSVPGSPGKPKAAADLNDKQVVIIALHPNASDADWPGEARTKGRVMINTIKEDGETAKGPWHTPFQTEDGKVKISAYLKPGELANGTLVYFRVKHPDPDDKSPYATSDDDADGDNRDKTEFAGLLTGVGVTGEGELTAEKVAAVARIDATVAGNLAVATVILNLGKKSGDNYIVECSLDSELPERKILRIPRIVAWKRVGYTENEMWRESVDLTRDFYPSSATPPPASSTIYVSTTAGFASGDKVKVFDSANPSGEPVTVGSISESDKSFTVTPHLRNQYMRGSYPDRTTNGKLAAVALINKGTYKAADISGLLGDAYGRDTPGEDGGCFVEFTHVNGGMVIPKRNSFNSDSMIQLSLTYLPTKKYVLHVLSAGQDVSSPNAWGQSANTLHICSIFCIPLTNPDNFSTADEQKKASGKTVAHEFMHILGSCDDCQHTIAHDNLPVCLMYSPAEPDVVKDGHAEGGKDEVYQVRDSNPDF